VRLLAPIWPGLGALEASSIDSRSCSATSTIWISRPLQSPCAPAQLDSHRQSAGALLVPDRRRHELSRCARRALFASAQQLVRRFRAYSKLASFDPAAQTQPDIPISATSEQEIEQQTSTSTSTSTSGRPPARANRCLHAHAHACPELHVEILGATRSAETM
jgi:hypothetical protein